MGESRLITGNTNEALTQARVYAQTRIGVASGEHPDITTLTYQGLTVDDVRALRMVLATGPVQAPVRVVIIRAERFFSEAQNAFLKMLEEPLDAVCLILSVPSEAILIDTVLSRLTREENHTKSRPNATQDTRDFLSLSKKERDAYITKLTDTLRTGQETTKREFRNKARILVEGIALLVRSGEVPLSAPSRGLLLHELSTFIPLMHERSAPVKMILLHLAIVLPYQQ